ncbi:HutD family protein [Flavobacterium sp. CBA20B-1]|uniref:HutD family protein n=1 Tax=unclassified Flavobacterium TaxID=196869 RepID=UPI0022249ACB|nr:MULTISPECIES: HutD family protein [unclassified Flavobacterium]WCM42162.1 HutD family protein [Flavobacterium sp. CBA20B-1]
MKITKISKDFLNPTVWDGGETYEYFIYPPGSNYSERNFLFRISVATIIKAPSIFTRFENYQRFLLMLNGDLHVYQNGKEAFYNPNIIFQFDSNDTIQSFSEGIDFNFMAHKNAISNMIQTNNTQVLSNSFVFIFAKEPMNLSINSHEYHLQPNDLLVINNEQHQEIRINLHAKAIIGYCNKI